MEKEEIFKSKVKSVGIFNFKEFYKFCYDWLSEYLELDILETKYKEKINGNEKEIEVDWDCERKVTDYFKYRIKIEFRPKRLQEVEVTQGNAKIKTNKGEVEITVKGILERDYQGKYDKSSFRKFMRSVYEKWVIPARIKQYENKLFADCDEFISQMKAYLDLEGKR